MADPNVPPAVSALVDAPNPKNGVALPHATYDALLASYATMYNHRRELRGDIGLPTFLDAHYGAMDVLCTGDDFYALAMAYFARAAARDCPAVFRAVGLDSNEVTTHGDVGRKDTHAHIREAATRRMGGVGGADRIGHGLDAADEPELLALVKERGLGLTPCPHAYHHTDWVFGSIRKMWEAGIPFTIASMAKTRRDGVNMSWAPDIIKQSILRALDEFEAGCLSAVDVNGAGMEYSAGDER
ncbi:hypothetical protein HDZ31DRAFT_66633 [Schizophyllum fasciatum]